MYILVLAGKEDAITIDWTPKGSNTDVKRYLEELPEDLLPVKGSEAAKMRKQRLQKQMPAHDIDATLCHALSPEEIKQLEEYVAHIRKHSVGQGKIIQLPMIRSQQHKLGGANSQYLHQHMPAQVASSQQVYLQASNLTNNLQNMSLRDKNNRTAFLNSQIPIDEQVSNYRNEKLNPNYCPQNIQTSVDLQNPVYVNKPTDLVYEKYQKPQNPKYSNVPSTNVQDTVNSEKYYTQNPEYTAKLTQNPEYIAKLLQNPDFIKQLCQNVDYAAKLTQNPEFAKKLAQNPDFIKHLCQNVDYATRMIQNPEFAKNLIHNPDFIQKLIQNPNCTIKLMTHNPIFAQTLALNPEFAQKLIQNPDLTTRLLNQNPEFAQKLSQNPIFLQNPELANRIGLPQYANVSSNTKKPLHAESYHKSQPEFASSLPKVGQTVPYDKETGYIPQYPSLDKTARVPCDVGNPLDNASNYLPYNTDVPYNFESIPEDLGYGENINVPLTLPLTTSNVERHQEQFQDYDMKHRVPIPVYNAENKLHPKEYEQNISSVGYIRDIDYNIPKIQKSDIENQNIISTCHRCEKIFDEGSIAITVDRTDSLWHSNCFTCHTCNQPLADLLYFYHKETDNIYCGRDYAILKGIPRCAACDELIFVREYCLAEERTFHIKHFCCFECDEPLAGKQYVMENNQPICVHCYEKLKAEKCTDCGYVIGPEEQGVYLEELHWHATDTCFVCKYCRKALLGQKLLLRNKNLFCSDVCYKTYHA